MISPALASIFRSGRADFNARFAAACHVRPDLDAGAFSEFLQTAVDDLVRTVDRVRPDRVPEHQDAEGALLLRLTGAEHDEEPMRKSLLELFGPAQRLAIEQVGSFEEGKLLQYTSDVAESKP